MAEPAGAEESVLNRIARAAKERLERQKTDCPPLVLKKMPFYGRKPRDFSEAFKGEGPNVIAEIKFASPSEGKLKLGREVSADLAVKLAGDYLEAGACALSILTEPDFFSGSPKFLNAVRQNHPKALLLMKDFIFDPYQLFMARAHGADAVLLIAALLGGDLKTLLEDCRSLGLSALVEVHDEAELELAGESGAKIIGVNSRDLRTLKTDLAVAKRLAPLCPGAVRIAESGIKTRKDLDELSALGYNGFLIGASLMKTDDPGRALKELLA